MIMSDTYCPFLFWDSSCHDNPRCRYHKQSLHHEWNHVHSAPILQALCELHCAYRTPCGIQSLCSRPCETPGKIGPFKVGPSSRSVTVFFIIMFWFVTGNLPIFVTVAGYGPIVTLYCWQWSNSKATLTNSAPCNIICKKRSWYWGLFEKYHIISENKHDVGTTLQYNYVLIYITVPVSLTDANICEEFTNTLDSCLFYPPTNQIIFCDLNIDLSALRYFEIYLLCVINCPWHLLRVMHNTRYLFRVINSVGTGFCVVGQVRGGHCIIHSTCHADRFITMVVVAIRLLPLLE